MHQDEMPMPHGTDSDNHNGKEDHPHLMYCCDITQCCQHIAQYRHIRSIHLNITVLRLVPPRLTAPFAAFPARQPVESAACRILSTGFRTLNHQLPAAGSPPRLVRPTGYRRDEPPAPHSAVGFTASSDIRHPNGVSRAVSGFPCSGISPPGPQETLVRMLHLRQMLGGAAPAGCVARSLQWTAYGGCGDNRGRDQSRSVRCGCAAPQMIR